MITDDQWIGQIYQQQSRRVLSTLIRLLGDFSLAEESMQEAFAAAVRQWPVEGAPENPTAWLIRTGQRRGIDQIRRARTAHSYSRSDGDRLFDVQLSAEAIRLAEVLARLLPEDEVFGLLALMLLQNSRQKARQDEVGNLISLEDQDRSLWDRVSIDSGFRWLEAALIRTPTGPYTLQASIAAVHADAEDAGKTDWARIVRLYDALYQQQPSPVIALNRAVAIAMRDTPADGLRALEQLLGQKALAGYHLFHAARADLLRREGQMDEARQSYERALALVSQGPERRFLERRLAELTESS